MLVVVKKSCMQSLWLLSHKTLKIAMIFPTWQILTSSKLNESNTHEFKCNVHTLILQDRARLLFEFSAAVSVLQITIRPNKMNMQLTINNDKIDMVLICDIGQRVFCCQWHFTHEIYFSVWASCQGFENVTQQKFNHQFASHLSFKQWLFCRRRQFALGVYFSVIIHMCLYSQICYNNTSDTVV